MACMYNFPLNSGHLWRYGLPSVLVLILFCLRAAAATAPNVDMNLLMPLAELQAWHEDKDRGGPTFSGGFGATGSCFDFSSGTKSSAKGQVPENHCDGGPL